MEATVQPVDQLIDARWIIPIEPPGVVLERHSVAVTDGLIVGLCPTAEADARYAATERTALDAHVLLPGFVNAHTHAAMSLLRGCGDDQPLMAWLRDYIWPAEARHVSPQFVYDGTLLACAEMLRGGITCANDMYFFPQAAGQAFLDSGMRAALGLIVIEAPTVYGADPDDYIGKGLEARDRLRDQPLLSFCMAPHAPYTVSDRSFTRIATIAEELDLPIHLHLHETQQEISDGIAQHGVRPFERLRALGLLSPRLIAVHAVHLIENEIAALAENGCSVAHCPASNLKLAGGFAPVAALQRAGVNVALGTDGAASNNRLDILGEMRLAALLAKGVAQDATALPAHAALRCATLGGAQALGLQERIGSIEPGKAADLVALRLDAPGVSPVHDSASRVVYSAGRENVDSVWVNGERRMAHGALLKFPHKALEKALALWQNNSLK